MNWFNYYGLALMVIIMIPNIVYAIKQKNSSTNSYRNKAVEVLEQLGRYGVTVFMIFNIPYTFLGFYFSFAETVYIIINAVLVLSYCLLYVIMRKESSIKKALLLSIIPSLIFVFSSVMIVSVPLFVFTMLFAVAHISISVKSVKSSNPSVKAKKKSLIILSSIVSIVVVVFLFIITPIVILTPKADKMENENIPDKFFIANGTYIDYQESNDCSAYAAAYVLRCLGTDISGKELYPQINRFFGMMTIQSVNNAVEMQGHFSKGYYGSIDTLKQRISLGKPIICCITDKGDTHFVVAVGYDGDYIYLVDSIKENTNVSNTDLYNRRVEIKDFEGLWKNKWYFCNNIYIVVE